MKDKIVDIENLVRIQNGEISFTEYAMSHDMRDVELMRKQIERGQRIGEKPQITQDIQTIIAEQAMSVDLKQNPRGLLDLAEKLEGTQQ